MSAGSTLFWAGVAVIGIALIAPDLGPDDARPATEAGAGGKRPEPGSPSRTVGNGFAAQELHRAGDGHFYTEAQVNGARILFMIDTGASIVALTSADAQRAGIALPSHRTQVMGAGGAIEVIPVSIDRIAVGPLAATQVRGAVADRLPVSLLGQSFLSQVGSVEIRGDRMILR